jgi:hypothetical protein
LPDEPVESALGPTKIPPRLPPSGGERGREGGDHGRGRHRPARALRRSREQARRELQAEIDHGNGLLTKAGHHIRLELLPGSGNVPDRVAICYPDEDGKGERCVTRTVRRRELQQWLARLEGLQGLVIDTER